MEALKPERLCEIFCSATKGYGTGYELGRGIILTARHVLRGDAQAIPPEGPFRIRSLAMAEHASEFVPANLVWPNANLVNNPDLPDVALLHAPGLAGNLAVVPLGLGDRSDAEELDVLATGFPHFQVDERSGRRDTKRIRGTVSPLNARVSDIFQIEVISRLESPGKRWQGFSGAPLFAEDRIIGVVIAKPGDTSVDFTAARLGRLPGRYADFAEVLREVATWGPALPTKRPPINLAPLVCRLGRDVHETQFCVPQETLADPQGRVRPLLYILTGEQRHRPDELLNRFATVSLPERLKWPEDTARFRPVGWPSYVGNTTGSFALLRQGLWNSLGMPSASPVDPEPFREALRDPARPRLFQSTLPPGRPSVSQGKVFELWAAFWDSLADAAPAALSSKPPVHLVIMPEAEIEDVAEWLLQLSLPATLNLTPLDTLPMCQNIELSEWIDQRVPPRLGPYDPARLEALRLDLSRRLGGREFALHELVQEVGRMSEL